VVAEEKHWPVLRQIAEAIQAAHGDGVKRAPAQPAKVKIQDRVENVVLVGRDHFRSP
jgi:hypothetical protein